MNLKKSALAALCLFVAAISWGTQKSGDALKYKTDENVAYGQHERNVMDVYYPKNVDAPVAVVVWFHGGGLTGGNKYVPKELKNAGLVVVAANYRLIAKSAGIKDAAKAAGKDSDVTAADCIDDAAACVAWTVANISKYNGDTAKIFVAGHSAGGYLTSMLGLDKKWLAKYGIDADSIRGYAPFSGQAITHFEPRRSMGISQNQPLVDEMAPLWHVRGDAAPFLIVSGDRELEMCGRYEEQAYFWRMLKVNGHKDATIYEMQGFNHGAMPSPGFHVLKAFIKRLTK